MLARRGTVEARTVWEIRRAVYGLEESPRLWQEERQGSFQADMVLYILEESDASQTIRNASQNV
eukprot:12912194-Prorocentrum_lima.AAC.1